MGGDQLQKNVTIAVFLIFVTYGVLGLLFYLIYPGWKLCISDVFINVNFTYDPCGYVHFRICPVAIGIHLSCI